MGKISIAQRHKTMNGVTDAEGVYLGKQLETNLEELNILPLASLDIPFSSFCSR